MIKDSFVEGAYPARKPRESAPRTPPTEPGIGVHRHSVALTRTLVGHLDRSFLVGFQLTEDGMYPGCC
jgi:hypothetical protein